MECCPKCGRTLSFGISDSGYFLWCDYHGEIKEDEESKSNYPFMESEELNYARLR